MTRLLFVCLGNICRSPTAEAVMRSLVEREGLADAIEVDSAGTAAFHAGSPPDPRASEAASARGVQLTGLARKVTRADFEDFDVLVAMDRANQRDVRERAPSAAARAKVRLLREFDPASVAAGALEVPDPYYGGEDGFGEVFELVRLACSGLLEETVAGRVP